MEERRMGEETGRGGEGGTRFRSGIIHNAKRPNNNRQGTQ